MTIEDMKKDFAEHPEIEALIHRQYDYYLPRWAAERRKEDTFKQIPEVDKQCIFQCILLMNITEEEIKALWEKTAYQQAETLLRDVKAGRATALDELHTLYVANVATEKALIEKKLGTLKYQKLPADKRRQIDNLRTEGKGDAVARILATYKKYGVDVDNAEQNCKLFDTLTGLFDVRSFTAEFLEANESFLPVICAAVASPRLLLPLAGSECIPNGVDALPGGWYLHHRLTVAEYKELLTHANDAKVWGQLFRRTADAIREKAKLPVLAIEERKDLILSVLENFENGHYGSAMILIFSLIEGLLWMLTKAISAKEKIFVKDKEGWVYDCESENEFQTNRIRDILERTAVKRYLDPAFIREFCQELYEERNPVLHGGQICSKEICNHVGICFLQKLFVLDYVLGRLEKLQDEQVYGMLDELYRRANSPENESFPQKILLDEPLHRIDS